MRSARSVMSCLGRFRRSVGRVFFVAGLAFVGSNPAFAIECRLAKTEVEVSICASALLFDLDTALNAYYQGAFYSDIGDGARSWLRSSQRSWLKKRNACKTDDCLFKLYVSRVDELCEIPVISGIHFICEMSDTILERHGGKRSLPTDAKSDGAAK